MYTIYYILSQIPDHSSKNASQAAASSSRRSCSTCSSIASSGLSRTSMMPKEGRNGGALLARALQRKRNADRISFSALARPRAMADAWVKRLSEFEIIIVEIMRKFGPELSQDAAQDDLGILVALEICFIGQVVADEH